MDHLPSLSPKKLIRVLEKVGFSIVQQSGSHVKFKHHRERNLNVVVPLHNKDLPRGFLKTILKQARIAEEEFRKLL